jgi:hypothetical protein
VWSSMHHELCFGCGRTNLFGLLMEAERTEDDRLTGRWFVKQDHQGPERGRAHPGIVASALIEAAMLAVRDDARVKRIELELEPGAAPAVGSFCDVEANGSDETVEVVASADGHRVGKLSAVIVAPGYGSGEVGN